MPTSRQSGYTTSMSSRDELIQFRGRCDPGAPATADNYVDRNLAFAQRIDVALEASDTAHVLVIGQTGVGKTTELSRLEQTASDRFLFIRPPLDLDLDLANVGALDLFVYGALWAAETLMETDNNWFAGLNSALKPQQPLNPNRWLSSGGPPAPTGLQRFRNNLVEVKQTIRLGPAQFMDLSKALTESIERKKGKDVVYVFDGLEKMPDSAASNLFNRERRTITTYPCRAVFTAPLSLSFEPFFGDVQEDFSEVVRIRAALFSADEPGFQHLLEMARRRGAEAVFAPDLLAETIAWSGGLPRQLVQLMGAAATQAITDGLPRVEPETFHRARQRVAERWQYQLDSTAYSALIEEDTLRLWEDRARLLRLGALVEFDGPQGLKIEMNPLLGPIVNAWQERVGD